MSVIVLTEYHLESLSLKGGYTGSSESKCHIVGNHMSRLNHRAHKFPPIKSMEIEKAREKIILAQNTFS